MLNFYKRLSKVVNFSGQSYFVIFNFIFKKLVLKPILNKVYLISAPHANLMMKITAPLLTVNFTTLNWLSQLIISTVNSVQDMLTHLGFDASVDANKEQTNVHTDIRLECIMPKVSCI